MKTITVQLVVEDSFQMSALRNIEDSLQEFAMIQFDVRNSNKKEIDWKKKYDRYE